MKMLGDKPNAILSCHNYALMLLDMKIRQNIHDAMEGLIRESLFETMRDLNGYAFVGELKDKKWKQSIRKWHDTASGKRLGSRSGPQKDAANFTKKVIQFVPLVSGRITQEKLAEAMRISVRGLQKQMRLYNFSWKAVLEICAKGIKGRREGCS